MMKIYSFAFLTICSLLFTACQTQVPNALLRQTTNFNNDWTFSQDSTDNKVWESIQVPHTVKIEPLVVNYMWQGNSWYKKKFTLDLSANQKAFIRFEGVMQMAEIWFNDQWITEHSGGYLPFSIDITSLVISGKENILTIKVNNENNPSIPPGKSLETLDFSYYGGIYRDVTLSITNEVYITDPVHANKTASGGLLIHFTQVSQQKATGIIQLHVKNEGSKTKKIQFKSQIGDKYIITSNSFEIAAGADSVLTSEMQIDQPALWSPTQPHLYDVNIQLMADGQQVDQISNKIGIRKIELTEGSFLINDEKTFIRGTNRHQEYPYIGYALSDNAQYRDAVKIKNAGFDMVRLSHYPQDEAFLDACDELGIIVMNCIPGWQFIGDETFIENSYQNIRDLVRRDRNHPSVFFWEVSLNESNMSEEYMTKANQILREELPFDDVYSAGWMDHSAYDLFIPARQHGKAPDYWNFYKDSKRPVFIAEYGDWEYYAQNAGFDQIAFKDLSEEERTSRQLRGHGETRLLQQALNFQEAANSNRKGMSTIGHANWLMFDYNRGYADDIESSGISDIFRIEKPAYYFYQSQRPPNEKYKFLGAKKGPMVKIANNWTSNSPTQVRVYSNTEEVALYLNDQLIEKKKTSTDKYSSHLPYPPFVFDIKKFASGQLKAEGFINGQKVVEDIVNTPQQANSIQLCYDLSGIEISKAQADVVFVYASIVDDNGTLMPSADHDIQFSLEGANAELIGKNPVKAEAGIATILLRTNSFDNELKISATSQGLIGGEVMVNME